MEAVAERQSASGDGSGGEGGEGEERPSFFQPPNATFSVFGFFRVSVLFRFEMFFKGELG